MRRLLFAAVALLAAAGFAGCSEDDADTAMLAVPSNVRCAVRGEKSLKIAWDAVEGAEKYNYQFVTADGVTLSTATVTEPEAVLSGLTAATAYKFRVQACSDLAGSSYYSDYVSVSTAAVGEGAREPLAVPSPRLKETTATTASVEWEAVDHAAKYAYRLTKGDVVVVEAETADPAVTVEELAPSTEYRFAVRALAGSSAVYSNSEFSSELTLKTAEGQEEPKPVPQVALKFPAAEQDGVIRAFPGAEGAGMFTTGGRGGKVIHVTNLNDSGEGSLRAAVQASGPRTIVFDVAGTIELKKTLEIMNGDVTIAGQTAPGDGICLKNWELAIKADNVIVRFIRIRPGDDNGNDGMDAIGARDMQDIIIDHCSMSWSTDECASFYVNKNMTMQWCLMYESLRNGKHNKGSHGYGGIWGGAPASFHHNVLAHHDSRNPRFDGPEQYADQEQGRATAKAKNIVSTERMIDFRNNIVYNFCNYGGYGGVGIKANYIGNYYKWGPASYYGAGPSYKNGSESANKPVRRTILFNVDTYYDGNGLKTPVEGSPYIYIGDNRNNVFDTSVAADDRNRQVGPAVTADNKSGFHLNVNSKNTISPQWNWSSSAYPVLADGKACSVTTHSADEAMAQALLYGGASLRMDAADRRVLDDVKNGTGTSGENGGTTPGGLKASWYGIIDSPADKGGYPVLTATDEEKSRASKDTDGDGIPDYYETLLGLNADNAEDAAHKTLDPQGLYTNLEVYLHYLVQEIVEAQNASGNYTELK